MILNPEATLNPHVFEKEVERIPTRNGYGDALVALGEKNSNIVVLTADLAESTRVLGFQKKFPTRFIECGVAEQNMMGMAAGLALSGKTPFASSYATFVPGRAWDQIRVSICYTNANVKFTGAHAGISVGPDGATHQALEDIAMLRALPNLVILVPCDYEETYKAVVATSQYVGPVYIRLAREKTPVITTKTSPFTIGQSSVLTQGKDVTIIACGPLVYEALLAAQELGHKGIEAEVINASSIKPFDEKTLIASVKKTGCCVTLEEHQITGGLFGVVSETLARHLPTPIEPVGMPNCFGESGEPAELLEKYGMTSKNVIKAVELAIKRKQT
jgi:transketolase